MLGLKINLEKSELIPISEVLNLEDLVGALGCKVGALPTTYLVLSLGAPLKSSRERIQKKISIVEEIIFFKRWKVGYGKEHFVQFVDLLHVSLCHPTEGSY